MTARVVTSILIALASAQARAGDVEIVRALLEAEGAGAWRVSVTLLHADTGWDHYADGWRVVAPDGTVLGTRTLYHPHVDEQPFTRSLGDVRVPEGVTTVRIEAHDKVHGWSADTLSVNLGQSRGERFEIRR